MSKLQTNFGQPNFEPETKGKLLRVQGNMENKNTKFHNFMIYLNFFLKAILNSRVGLYRGLQMLRSIGVKVLS